MQTKRKILVGLMAACLAGGVGTAFAMTRTSKATATGTAGAMDQAVYLYWDGTNSSVELENVTNLVPGTPQYRYLDVSPKTTKSLTGTLTLTFTLSAGANQHLEGLTLTVNQVTEHAGSTKVEDDADVVLNKSNLEATKTLAIESSSAAHVTNAYYRISIEYDGSNDSAHPTYVLGGQLNIAQSFAKSA